jgi:hypothetical protein
LPVGRFCGSYATIQPASGNRAKVVSREIGCGLCSFCVAHSRATRFKQLRARCAPPAILFGWKLSRFEKVKRLALG